jgi:hypothetical protein
MTYRAIIVAFGLATLCGSAHGQRTILAPTMDPSGRLIPGSGLTTNDESRQQFWAAQRQMENIINDSNWNLRDPLGNRHWGRNNIAQWLTPDGLIVDFPCRFCQPLR